MDIKYKVLPRVPADSRLTADRHTDTVFPITRFGSKEEIDARREQLRFNLRMAAGLYPWPEKTKMNVVRESVGSFDGFTVEKIMFETRPGFWSTGNLYLPSPLEGKHPAILNVIGHWENQRLTRQEDADYPQQLANFARMGFVCLVTDMIGKVDSRQISHEYGGGDKELWLSNGLGVQLWNNIRALDLLCDMPEVDPERLGVTGASGGGSQSLFLALADDRIKAAAPINMISLLMQGGCMCENAPGLRRETDNGEMCSMIAPRALFLAGSTGDWTREQETREVPEILGAYRLYGAEDNFSHYYQVADHQYNAKTRRRVYSFFARHLMGRDVEWEEQPIDIGDVNDLTWYRGAGKAPGIDGDGEFLDAFIRERAEAVSRADISDKKKMLAWMTGVNGSEAVEADEIEEKAGGAAVYKSVMTSYRGEQVPFVKIIPDGWDGRKVCLALGGGGKSCADDPRIAEMTGSGTAVISCDLFLTGEYGGAKVNILGGGQGERYCTTFHYTPDAFKVQDAEHMWRLVLKTGSEHYIWAEGEAAPAAACALPLLEGVTKAFIDEKGLCGSGCFIPGIMLLGGAKGCFDLAGCEKELF